MRALIALQKGKQTSREVNVNGGITFKGTALTVAATRRHAERVKLPMKREAGMKDDFGEAALMHTSRGGYLEIAETIKTHGDFDESIVLMPEDGRRAVYYP